MHMCPWYAHLCINRMSIGYLESEVIIGLALNRTCIWFLVAASNSPWTIGTVEGGSVVGRKALRGITSSTYELGRVTESFGRLYKGSVEHAGLSFRTRKYATITKAWMSVREMCIGDRWNIFFLIQPKYYLPTISWLSPSVKGSTEITFNEAQKTISSRTQARRKIENQNT